MGNSYYIPWIYGMTTILANFLVGGSQSALFSKTPLRTTYTTYDLDLLALGI
jgi:hypothetical protein